MSINEYDQWLGVELRHLAALEAVAEEESFGRAARRLGYTQSAVSQQIAQLEKVVGAKLVERPGGPRAVSLTDAGRLLLRHADAIVARLAAAQADMAALQAGEAGPLRVGILQSVGARLLPGLIRRFKQEFPRVSVQVVEGNTPGELLPLVESGELDFTFAELPLQEGPFDWVELLRDPYVLLVSAGSHLATREAAPPLRELTGLPMIGWRTDRGHDIPGVEYAFRSDDNGTVLGLVEADLGVAVAPRLVLRPDRDGIVALPFGARLRPRVLGLAWHKERYRSPAAERFVELAGELAGELRSNE
ncbi:MAG TPA: LysR substrate-binding domain-containing protein [Gaiellaceae bacterium]|jgi:DNA-binding transcriptional LysR family regulator|nr:LysR substrate-binding domain-containing protein [Gaiellaceae bacterium]